jgi:hypothetical protein
MKRIAMALLLLATAAPAQEIERVTVYGGSLSGFCGGTLDAFQCV